ncbi:hypothetical protein [Butyribacter intestini]|uniref:hypothetical protein n=1 Tax=Butyribacter intestini TaxID=1703332 RepID=UPI003AB3B1D8
MTNLVEFAHVIEKKEQDVCIDQIVSMEYGSNKKTGARFMKATLEDGHSIIRTITNSGVICEQSIKIGAYNGIEERNRIISDLYKEGYKQDDIASFMGISQSTVSGALNKGGR